MADELKSRSPTETRQMYRDNGATNSRMRPFRHMGTD